MLEAAIVTVLDVGKTRDELCPSSCPLGPADVPAISLDEVIVEVNRGATVYPRSPRPPAAAEVLMMIVDAA